MLAFFLLPAPVKHIDLNQAYHLQKQVKHPCYRQI